MPRHEIHDLLGDVARLVGLYVEEVAGTASGKLGHLPGVDPVCVGDDPALRCLPENLRQAHDREGVAGDHVLEYLAGADRGQLVNVADQQQRSVAGQRLHRRVHQHDVDHAGLVDHQQVALQRVLGIALEPALAGIALEQAVERHRCLGQPLGSAPGRSGKRNPDLLGGEGLQDRPDQRCLADAATAGHDAYLRHQGQAQRIALARRQCDRTQKPVSPLWNVTRSTAPAIRSWRWPARGSGALGPALLTFAAPTSRRTLAAYDRSSPSGRAERTICLAPMPVVGSSARASQLPTGSFPTLLGYLAYSAWRSSALIGSLIRSEQPQPFARQ